MVDQLASSFGAVFTVSDDVTNTATNVRYGQYKNRARSDGAQERRRAEFLERQKEARFDHANHARKLALNQFDAIDDEPMDEQLEEEMQKEEEAMDKKRYNRNRYRDQLMLSEWLIDIPEQLSDAWLMFPCPVGRRCLIVASGGVTTAYDKAGRKTKQFQSFLPGGSRTGRGYSIIDGVFNEVLSTFFCLDLISWNQSTYSDSDVECRHFMLQSRISENSNFQEICKKTNPYRFVVLPYCVC